MTTEVDDLTGGWDMSTLPPNVQLGERVFIERRESFRRFFTARDPGLVLADDVTVYGWSEFSIDPEGVVEVGPRSVLVGAAFMCADRITVGADVVISYWVTIADSDFHPLDPTLRRQDAIASSPGGSAFAERVGVEAAPVRIGDRARIGPGSMILKGVTIGKDAEVAPGSVVTRDVPDGMRASGNPATVTGPV
jgi:acetyltransferase-like isoleucine patch superfamily enzyme